MKQNHTLIINQTKIYSHPVHSVIFSLPLFENPYFFSLGEKKNKLQQLSTLAEIGNSSQQNSFPTSIFLKTCLNPVINFRRFRQTSQYGRLITQISECVREERETRRKENERERALLLIFGKT